MATSRAVEQLSDISSQEMALKAKQSRGRPQIHSDSQVLAAAMTAFSEHGYDAMSVRLLNRDMGLSHGTINQRFGPKEKLFTAAVDRGLEELHEDLDREKTATFPDDLDELHDLFYRFLIVCNRKPQLIRFIQKEATKQSVRTDYITNNMATPYLNAAAGCMSRLIAAERIKPIEIRSVLMLLVFGATAPLTMPSLASKFGNKEPVDAVEQSRTMADIIVSGMTSQQRHLNNDISTTTS